MAAALKEVKEKNMPLAIAAKKFGVPRNTLRARLVSVTGRQEKELHLVQPQRTS
jgi:hypothetical protein